MEVFKFFPFFCFIFLVQACSLSGSKHQDTVAPTILDGAWIKTKCTCSGKDDTSPDVQMAHTLIINGNLMFQNQIVRWRKFQLNRYCSTHQEATLNSAAGDSYDVTTISERTFSPVGTVCAIPVAELKRTWKIFSLKPSEFSFESTTGCESGPMVCTFKRLDQ